MPMSRPSSGASYRRSPCCVANAISRWTPSFDSQASFSAGTVTIDPNDPNVVWVGDITYIATKQGWLYLAVLIDLFSRRVVGWSMADHLRTELPLAALKMAMGNRDTGGGLLHHSDRGCQYTSRIYQEELGLGGITAPMSRAGNCHANAVVESCNGTLKTELFFGLRRQRADQHRR